uniref:Tyrosine-protein kinase receptor Tie-2-like n=1 Tax=Crassostrea virginica TaxID=6565 RepID=A0A8B8AVI0_CRAVI|nr:tyrosine-protein kinase receptor Tie-2-like [Crassostrea virginica]
MNVHLLIYMYVPVSIYACSAGYFGPNCSLPCRYPSYGVGCQFKCVCGMEKCKHITGCHSSNSKENRTMITPSEERTSHVVMDYTFNDGLKNSTMLTPSEERTPHAVIDDTINDGLGVLSGCSSMRTKTNTSAKQEAMKITIWTMVSLSLVFVTIYFKLNKKKTSETANVI